MGYLDLEIKADVSTASALIGLGFCVFACERCRLSAQLGSLPSEKYKSKAGCRCRRKPYHQRALGFRSEMVSLGKGRDGQSGGCFFMKSILPGRAGLGAAYACPCLRGLSPQGTLRAKPLRGDGEEPCGGPAVVVGGEGGLCWRGFPCPTAQPGCCSLCSPPQVTRISSLHSVRAWGGHGVMGDVCKARRVLGCGEMLSASAGG